MRSAAALWRRHPMEGTAVLLVGVGGLILPSPVWLLGLALWLLGVGAALPSKLWGPRDKWVGLAGPVFIVIAGTVAFVTVGGRHPSIGAYGHEILADSIVLVRVAAVLGAGFLARRLQRGPRAPAVPPWNRRHRL